MSRRQHLGQLRDSAPAILPSLLQCDFGNLEREIAALAETRITGLHLDVMDGHFVPNLTYGMPLVKAIRGLSELPLDVHLMIEEPQRYIEHFYEAGADILTIHAEAVEDPRPVLESIRAMGMGAGLAFNPGTPVPTAKDTLSLCDLVLVMSVEAGFGGQPFQAGVLEKFATIRSLADEDLLLEIDGGINPGTIRDAAAAGAELFVVGSAIFGQSQYTSAVEELRALAS